MAAKRLFPGGALKQARQICRAVFCLCMVESDLENHECGMVEQKSFMDSIRRIVEPWLRFPMVIGVGKRLCSGWKMVVVE